MEHMRDSDQMMMNMSGEMAGMTALCILWIVLTIVLIILGTMAIIVMYRKYFKNGNKTSKKDTNRE